MIPHNIHPDKPKPPPGSIRYDACSCECPICHSNLKHTWIFFHTSKCINKECTNYYKLVKSQDQSQLFSYKDYEKE